MFARFNIYLSLIFLLIAADCSQNRSATTKAETSGKTMQIKGAITEGAGETVILEEMGAREYIPIDTVICDNSGAFEIAFAREDVAFYVLRYGLSGYVTLLLEPGESIEFSVTKGNNGTYKIKGSKGSELLYDLNSEHKQSLDALGEITRKNREFVSSPGYAEMKRVFDNQFDSITSQFHSYSLRFIHDNSSSLAILVALYNLYGQGLPVFHPQTDLQVYQFVDSVLMSKYPDFEAVQLLHAQVTETEQALINDGQVEQLPRGEIAPDFVSSRPDGSQMALSDLKGSYVFLSFWAGWSQLSREENNTLRRAQEIYGTKNFRILQVSFDDSREVWTSAIKEERLNWDHVSELRRWETPVADLYYIEKIPSNVLIDPTGRIIDIDLFGEQLMNKLEIIFGK